MTLRLITPPTVQPITLAELKVHCRVDSADLDGVLTGAIAGATDKAEGILGRALINQTWERVLDAFPAGNGGIALGRPPISAITQLQYVPSGSTSLTTLAPTEYVLDNVQPDGWALPSTTWPATASLANAVRVRFTAGYGADGSSVPSAIRSWLFLTAGWLYRHAEAMDASGKVVAIPDRFVDSLLDPYRVWSL